MEWFALLIPIIGSVILKVCFHHKIAWWEMVLPMLPVFVIVPIVKLSAESVVTSDYERHGGWVVEATYYEDWDEWIVETCSSTDSKGNTTTYDCSYRKYHPAYWELLDSNGYVVSITSDEFEMLAKKFRSRKFVDLHRWSFLKDGDKYVTTWPGLNQVLVPVATEHRYVNRVQATVGVLAYDKVSKPQERGIHAFPKLSSALNDHAILGSCEYAEEADRELQKANGRLGARKQVRMWVCLFHNQPLSVGLEQEAHWKGGNKNEVVTCIGLGPHGEFQWCHVFCWSPDGNTSNDIMKSEIRQRVKARIPFDLRFSVDEIVRLVEEKFIRKDFKEFSYLTVETPVMAVWLIYILVLLSTLGIDFWAVQNEFDADAGLLESFQR